MSEHSGSPSQDAREVFEDHLARSESGESRSIEQLAEQHPDLADELRILWADWQRVAGVIEGLGDHASVAAFLKRRHGSSTDSKVSVDPGLRAGDEAHPGSLHQRLMEESPRQHRYHLCEEVARGAMGAVMRVWDEDLRRNLAMKIILSEEGASGEDQPPAGDPIRLERFLEEAQITSQLDHPGIVPVHELGVDSEGRVFYTMPLVKGHSLKQIFGFVHQQEKGWSVPRTVGILIKVCEAMAYAHAKGVIHRDVKPANIMVGRFGQTYVMDWGLAHVEGHEDTRDIRVRPRQESRTSVVQTDRHLGKAQTPDSPLITMDGDVIGTPCYMSPEQARGEVDKVGFHSDIYSIGAMLYHLLSGQMPYVPPGARVSQRTILGLVVQGPPRPLHEVNPDAPDGLIAICEKAMARDPRQRYATPLDMARDMEAFLGRRPMPSIPPGLGQTVRLFVQRNKAVAGTVVAALAVLVTTVVLFVQSLQGEVQAKQVALDAKDVLVDVLEAPALILEREELYPLTPENAPRLQSWIDRADALLTKREDYETALAASDGVALAGLDGAELEDLVTALHELGRVMPIVEVNHEIARDLERHTLGDPEWVSVIEDIELNEQYGNLKLRPQLGLVPLQLNPSTDLWEFWHYTSGQRPECDEVTGEVFLTEESALVFVLVPGGTFLMGGAEEDKEAEWVEKPQHQRSVEPFFISRFEVTQFQWFRIMESNPSGMAIGRIKNSREDIEINGNHPVENATWFNCRAFLDRLELEFPSEERWEYACRAGELTPFHWGADHSDLERRENIMDSAHWPRPFQTDAAWNDGYRQHAPVGSYPGNRFGLHDMHGNVSEWCLDWDSEYLENGSTRLIQPTRRKVWRGGNWALQPVYCRSSYRGFNYPRGNSEVLGLRPVRSVRMD